jgi:hypothetical protein
LDDGTNLSLPLAGSQIALPAPSTPVSITLVGPLSVRGLSLVDTRSGAFQSLTLGPYRLVHSGDVKVYEHQAVLPRAFVVPAAEVASGEAALTRLADPAFDPATTVLLPERPPGESATPGRAAGPAVIVAYVPELVQVRAAGPGHLVLTDAHYPGWHATLDGQPVPILPADLMFRAVALPPGEHEIVFRYAPVSVWMGMGLSALSWLLLPFAWLARRIP